MRYVMIFFNGTMILIVRIYFIDNSVGTNFVSFLPESRIKMVVSNWMFPNLFLKNGWKSPFPSIEKKTGLLP